MLRAHSGAGIRAAKAGEENFHAAVAHMTQASDCETSTADAIPI